MPWAEKPEDDDTPSRRDRDTGAYVKFLVALASLLLLSVIVIANLCCRR
jgi:hypothetical protein